MSLVSEALRKARQEAAEREGRKHGIPRGLVLSPKRWRSGPGLVFAVLIPLAAAIAGAAIAWWALNQRAPATTSSVELSRPFPPASTPATAPRLSGTVAGAVAQGKQEPLAAPAGQEPRGNEQARSSNAAATPQLQPVALLPVPTPAPEPASGTGQSGPETTADQSGTQERKAHASPRERVFVVDADLGHAKLHLDYVVYRPGSPFAGINGQQVTIGSVIEGLQVDEISQEFVRLRDSRGTVVLRTH